MCKNIIFPRKIDAYSQNRSIYIIFSFLNIWKMKYDLLQLNPEEAYDFFLGTLSNKNRIKILNELLTDEKNVSELTENIGISQSTISNHLIRLKYCGFVTVKAKGKERYYSLNKETIEPLMRLINKHVSKYCVDCIRGGGKK